MKCRPNCTSEEELSEENGPAFEQHFVDPGPSPEEVCARREQSRVLREVVEELPERYGLAMQLCDVEGVEAQDATRILGISSGALKTCLFRARRLATRRIRGRFCPAGGSLQNQQNIISRPAQSTASSSTAVPVGNALSPHKKRDLTHARARKTLEGLGGHHEPKRKRSRFWKKTLPVSVHSAVRCARRPAC